MLKEDVLHAVEEGNFNIYAISTVDEGIELLTGVKAGKIMEDGAYEENSVNYLVEKALHVNAAKMKDYSLEKNKTTGDKKIDENNES